MEIENVKITDASISMVTGMVHVIVGGDVR